MKTNDYWLIHRSSALPDSISLSRVLLHNIYSIKGSNIPRLSLPLSGDWHEMCFRPQEFQEPSNSSEISSSWLISSSCSESPWWKETFVEITGWAFKQKLFGCILPFWSLFTKVGGVWTVDIEPVLICEGFCSSCLSMNLHFLLMLILLILVSMSDSSSLTLISDWEFLRAMFLQTERLLDTYTRFILIILCRCLG